MMCGHSGRALRWLARALWVATQRTLIASFGDAPGGGAGRPGAKAAYSEQAMAPLHLLAAPAMERFAA
jgi:hypothetical protein